jgi:hypothetical protein
MISSKRVVTRTDASSSQRLPDAVTEGAVLVDLLRALGVLSEVEKRLQVRREGGYHGLDVVVFLLMHFAARRRLSIKEFGEVTRPHRTQLAALASRRKLPTPASVSRFLSVVEDAAVHDFIPWLLLEGAQGLDCLKDASVLMRDCLGQHWHVFDFDPTVTTLRQRALPAGDDLPDAKRRSVEARPGYSGRKRGDVQFSRATLQHAGSSLWLDVSSGPGNGNWRASSNAAVATVVRTCDALGFDTRRALIRVDGAAGNTPFITACENAKIGYVTRSQHYQLLDQPEFREHLNATTWYVAEDSRSGPRRQVADLGWLELPCRSVDDDGKPFEPVRARVVVARFEAPETPHGAGRVENGWQYELFLTNLADDATPAPEVVTTYYQRTGIENRFAQEDRELGLDRISSYHLPGQNLACAVALFVWNLRVTRGFELAGKLPEPPAQAPRVVQPVADKVVLPVLRAQAAAPTAQAPPVPAQPSPRQAAEPLLEQVGATMLASHPGWLWDPERKSVRCPAGQPAKLAAVNLGVPKEQGRLRFDVAAVHCHPCPKRSECLDSSDPAARKSKRITIPASEAEAIKREWDKPTRRRHRAERPTPRAAPSEPLWVPPFTVCTLALLAVSYAVLLPAKLKKLFTDATRATEIHVEVRLPKPPDPGCQYFATTDGERQNRRKTWSQSIAWNALPSGAEVDMRFVTRSDDAERLLRATRSARELAEPLPT